ncbi:MAG: glycine cleavage system protein H [Candidatus Lokiarchaeota archaeon]|nr:glycine cleavage system protein H [Candidatus Lokiarchaeota archaeon]
MVKVDEFEFPDDLYYYAGETDSLWMKNEDGKVRLGLTSLGAYAAGKIKFIRMRPPGKKVKEGRSIGTLESGKWTGAVKSPVGGTIVEVNEDIKDNPSKLNDDPYGDGWLVLIEPEDIGDLDKYQHTDGLEAWAKDEVAAKKAMKGE